MLGKLLFSYRIVLFEFITLPSWHVTCLPYESNCVTLEKERKDIIDSCLLL